MDCHNCHIGFLLQYTLFMILGIENWFILTFAEIPLLTIYRFQVWRLATYIFLHKDGVHILIQYDGAVVFCT